MLWSAANRSMSAIAERLPMSLPLKVRCCVTRSWAGNVTTPGGVATKHNVPPGRTVCSSVTQSSSAGAVEQQVEAPKVPAELFNVIGGHDFVGTHPTEIVGFGRRRRKRRNLTTERTEH